MSTAEPFMPADPAGTDSPGAIPDDADRLETDSGEVEEPTDSSADEAVDGDPAAGTPDTSFRTPEPGEALTVDELSKRSSDAESD